jgi:predicted alpha/beta-hydrolase family hydrolase
MQQSALARVECSMTSQHLPTEERIDTPHGPARAFVHDVPSPVGALVLGHGAGGGVGARDIVSVTAAARDASVSVVLVEQPYRVAGRRSPAPAKQLDAAWTAVLEHVRAGPLAGLQVVTGGRSSGARVACRTAEATGAAGVLCLAFPLHPPQRRTATGPPPSRIDELDAVTVPVLVVQGASDRFGMPPEAPRRTVVQVAGDHSLSSDRAAVAAAARGWLEELFSS